MPEHHAEGSVISPYKEFWPAQKALLECPVPEVDMDICVYQGGVGSGKTFIGALLGIMLSLKYPGVTGLVVALTSGLVRDTTFDMYQKHFDALGWRSGREYRIHKSEMTIRFPSGSKILFRHLENVEKLKSLTVGWIHMEEMSLCAEKDYTDLLARLRDNATPRKRLFGTTNPQGNRGWIYERFVKHGGLKETQVDGKRVLVNFRRIIAPTTENKALSDAYVFMLKETYDESYFNIFVMGQDGDYTKGLVCKMFSDLNIRETSEYKPDLKIWLTCDFNVDPMAWILAHEYNGEIHFFDEIVAEDTNIGECVDEFVRRYPSHQAGVVITGDASGNQRDVASDKVNQSRYDIMRRRFQDHNYPNVRLDVANANPLIEDRLLAWNAKLCNADGVRGIYMHPRCRYLILNCEELTHLEGTGKIKSPTPSQIVKNPRLKFMVHPLDAASYLVSKLYPVKYVQREKVAPIVRRMRFSI